MLVSKLHSVRMEKLKVSADDKAGKKELVRLGGRSVNFLRYINVNQFLLIDCGSHTDPVKACCQPGLCTGKKSLPH